MTKILVSAQGNSINCAMQELKQLFITKNIKELSSTIFLAEIKNGTDELLFNISKNKPIFIRYIIPVKFEDTIIKDKIDYSIINNLELNKDDTYVLHFNLINNDIINKQEVVGNILNYFKTNNININPKNANKIINITINNKSIYLGTLNIKDSLSSWNFGECRFKHENEQISRAELKLLEAFEYFNIKIDNYKTALDLGAAPGGWTRILLNKGLKVTAVDPAELHESLRNNQNLFHYQDISQKFFREHKDNKYDIIVNDMKMDTKKSIYITEEATKYLNDDGIVIMTLKLNPNREFEEIKECIDIIKENHEIIGVHQLFHNRSEVTIAFKNFE